MKKILFAVAFLFIIAGCNKRKIDQLNSTVTELIKVNDLAAFENILWKQKDADNLIISISRIINGEYHLIFEDGLQVNAASGLVITHGVDTATWSASFRLFNDSTVRTSFLGTRIDIPVQNIQLNPFFNAPLTATVNFDTYVNGKINLRVLGQDGPKSDIIKAFPYYGKNFNLPVYGLYAGYANTVEITFTNKADKERVKQTFSIQTAALPAGFPSFEIKKQYDAPLNNTMFLVDYLPKNIPFMVDNFGKIRWYSKGFTIVTKYALQRFKNGNLGYGSSPESKVVEYTMLGQLVKEWPVSPLYADIHHEVCEMPNGNFLVSVNKAGYTSSQDFILELNRETGAISNVWDLNNVLPKRKTFIKPSNNDWFHNNAITYDPSDNSIIVSGYLQGIVKLSWTNQLKWILSPPQGWWGYENFLLTPVNTLNGFEWTWAQHTLTILPNGNLFTFDNGFGRDFGLGGVYSRAVEYKINETAKTIEQVWQYGKERGAELASPFLSGAQYLPETQTKLMVSGGVSVAYYYTDSAHNSFVSGMYNNLNNSVKARILEINEDRSLAFEMMLKTPLPTDQDLVYRAYKMNIYP